MRNLKVTSLLAVLLFLFVAGIQAQTITPSKNYITKEVKGISNFSAINVLGSTDVEYSQTSGPKTTVSIYGSDNLIDLLEVSTVNGVLQVNMKKGVNIRSNGEYRLKVIASSPSLKKLELKGSADIFLKGTIKGADMQITLTGSGDIDAENFEFTNFAASVKGSGDIHLKNLKATSANIQVNGSGDVSVKGSAQRVSLSVNGSGDISAGNLVAANVVASVSGSGDIDCYASSQLDASVGGSGEIGYKGSPKIVNKQGRKDNISGR